MRSPRYTSIAMLLAILILTVAMLAISYAGLITNAMQRSNFGLSC